jgi:cell wall-associated NlpC family hydrolase
MSTLRGLLEEAGFHGHALDIAVSVAMAESGGHATAHNGNAGTGDNSYGLFQINMLGSLGPARLQQYGLHSYNDLYNPLVNAKVAYQMSDGGRNWTPWSTYNRGENTKYLTPGFDAPVVGGSYDPNVDTPTMSPTSSDPTDGHGHAGSGSDFDIGTGHSLSDADRHALDLAHSKEIVALMGHGGLPADNGLGVSLGGHDVGAGTGTASSDEEQALHTFLSKALAQKGDQYIFGAKGIGQADPTAFDCSGLTQWAADQAGVQLPAGAAYQYVDLKQKGMIIPVDKAIHTPGALLFHFATEPQPGLTGEPEIAHVAISLGNGKTIEAADPQDGVVSWDANGSRFNYAAVIPGISDMSPEQAHAAVNSLIDDPTGTDPTAADPTAGAEHMHIGAETFGYDQNTWDGLVHQLGATHGGGLHASDVGGDGHGAGLGGDHHGDHHGGLDIGH